MTFRKATNDCHVIRELACPRHVLALWYLTEHSGTPRLLTLLMFLTVYLLPRWPASVSHPSSLSTPPLNIDAPQDSVPDLLLPHYTWTGESHPFSWVQLLSTRWPLPNEYLELGSLFWGPHPSFPTTHLTSSTWTLVASLVAQSVNSLPAMQETLVWSLGWEDPLEKEMAIHSSILAWRIPWTEEPGGLQSTGVTKSWTWLWLSFHWNCYNNLLCLKHDEWHLLFFVCFISGNGTIYLSGCSGQSRESPPSIQSTSNPVNPPFPTFIPLSNPFLYPFWSILYNANLITILP